MSKCVSTFYVDFKEEHSRMVKSLLHFHPEVTLETLNKKQWQDLNLDSWGYPVIELPLFDKYDTVTHIDADVLVVDNISELFNDDVDVIAGRNNTDSNRCCRMPGVTLPNIPWSKYVNSGIHTISSKSFMEDWLFFTRDHYKEYKFGENDTFNHFFFSPKFTSRILDPIEAPIYYGTSINEGTKTFWDSWKEIVVVKDHLELNGKRIKLLHEAGGLRKRPPLSNLVTTSVLDFINDTILC